MRRLRRLLQRRAARWAERVFVAEGAEVIRVGLAAGVVPESVYLSPDADPDAASVALDASRAGARVVDLAPGVLERVASTVTPQPVLAVFPMLDVASVAPDATLVVVMVDVRDPGNAGTVLRTADASGADAVIWCGGTVDPYNPKTVRASAGSLFNVPIVVESDASVALGALGACRRVGTVVRDAMCYTDYDWSQPTALVLGNEAAGLGSEVPVDDEIMIPMAGRAESLNVGMACAVLCFEAQRQRRTTMPR